MAVLIKHINGEHISHYPRNGHHYQMDEYKEILSCSLTNTRKLSDGAILVFNDEMKFINPSAINHYASSLCHRFSAIEGSKVICHAAIVGSSNAPKSYVIAHPHQETLDIIYGDALYVPFEEFYGYSNTSSF